MSYVINTSAFNNLELLPQMYEAINYLKDEVKNLNKKLDEKVSFQKTKDVARYLNISPNTLYSWIQTGKFIKGVHYNKVVNNNCVKIVFIKSAIMEFQRKRNEIL